MTTTISIIVWYIACALVIWGFLKFYDFTNRPRYRDDLGDVTTEAGYSEDSTGRPLNLTCDDECVDSGVPHVESVGGTHEGSV